MKLIHAAFLIVCSGIFAVENSFAEDPTEPKMTNWADDVRTRQRPMIDELESMLGNDTKVTLYAVDPARIFNGDPDGTWYGKKMFRNHIVKSSAAIENHRECETLVHALTDGMRETQGGFDSSFEPFFGLTIERGNKRIDVLVCFTCMRAFVYGAYAGDSFILDNAHEDAFFDSAKKHGLGLPYRNAMSPAISSH
jgi:hypothetical protein